MEDGVTTRDCDQGRRTAFGLEFMHGTYSRGARQSGGWHSCLCISASSHTD